MRGFHPGRGGYVARMDADERTILARVLADTAQLLGQPVDAPDPGEAGDPAWRWPVLESEDIVPPGDPALARLLPSASLDDDALALEFRRLTEPEVRGRKAERLALVWRALTSGGDRVVVPREQAQDWAGAFTDVRLVLAERLGIEDEGDAEAVYARYSRGQLGAGAGADGGDHEEEEDEVALALSGLYVVLSWVQETLLEAMLADLPTTGEG